MDLLNGSPLLNFPLDPARLTRRLRWADGLSDSVTGVEARAALQRLPFAELTGRTAPATLEESRRGEEAIRAALEAGTCAWVDWACPCTVQGVAGSVLTLDSGADLTGVTHVWAYHPRGLGALRAVSALAGVSLTVASASGIQTGDLVYPVRLGHLSGVQSVGTAQGQGIRAFDLALTERPQLGAIDGTFSFWREDAAAASWLSVLSNVYFLIDIDTSGSMDDDVPAVTAAANALKVLLRDRVYGGEQEKADEFVRVTNWSTERWLQRLATKITGEASTKYVNLAFINEASSGYHSVPRNAASEPTSNFSTDYAAFVIEQARREFSRGKIYSINPTESSWEDDNAAFNAHLADAVEGNGNYAALGTPLDELGVSYAVEIAAGTEADWYLIDILNLMGVSA